jgi:hypothetical protein
LQIETEAPTRAWLLTDTELPREAKPKTDRLLAMRHDERTETELPTARKSIIDKALPHREKLLKLNELPTLMQSATLILLLKVAFEKTENPLPMRAPVRNDRLDPRVTKSNTLIVDPALPKLRILSDDPI